MKILVVDDDPIILELLSVVLQQAGYDDFSCAASGTDALKMLKTASNPFEFLVLDISMPEMDGIELCRQIRNLPPYAEVPVLMLTANTDLDSIEGAFVAGANDYITKPFDIKGIVLRIQVAARMMKDGLQGRTFDPADFNDGDATIEHPFNIGEPIQVKGIAQQTGVFSLGNYLLQLSKKRVFQSRVFAVHIEQIEDIYNFRSTSTYLNVLSEVTNIISDIVQDSQMLSCYLGNGTLLCISSDDVVCMWPLIEKRLVENLSKSKKIAELELGRPVSIAISRPFRPNASKTQRVRPTFDRASNLLENRLNSKRSKL